MTEPVLTDLPVSEETKSFGLASQPTGFRRCSDRWSIMLDRQLLN
ncbi:hypothetical protein [Myxosarcina sp. GI1(2024)]